MARTLLGAERRKSYTVSLEPTTAGIFKQIAGDSISAGVELLLRREIERNPGGEFAAIAELREDYNRRIKEEDAKRQEREQSALRVAQAKQAGKKPTKRQKELAAAVSHYMGLNEERYSLGKPLYDMSHMSVDAELQSAVWFAASVRYGWGSGPRPADIEPTEKPLGPPVDICVRWGVGAAQGIGLQPWPENAAPQTRLPTVRVPSSQAPTQDEPRHEPAKDPSPPVEVSVPPADAESQAPFGDYRDDYEQYRPDRQWSDALPSPTPPDEAQGGADGVAEPSIPDSPPEAAHPAEPESAEIVEPTF